jgi:translation initiation factor 2B subunit (eIF-2B alpha/beta/delta family)
LVATELLNKLVNTMDKLEGYIKGIADDNINGSNTILLNSIDVVLYALELVNPDTYPNQIKQVATRLKEAKPIMAAQSNIMDIIIKETNHVPDIGILKEKIISLKSKIPEATHKTIENAFNTIALGKNELSVITCSYSGAVYEFLKYCFGRNVKIALTSVEYSWRGVDFHKMMIEKCTEVGIEGRSISFDNIDKAISRSDCAIIGADSIFLSDKVINGTPSHRLALNCFGKLPFYVIAESYKKGDLAFVKDGFDFVPNSFITSIFSDSLF